MEIPAFLEEQVKAGKVALLLGSGASLEATDSHGDHAPRADQLRDLLADQFLGGKLKSRSLSQVAEYAISESSLIAVQDYIRQRFLGLRPTTAHLLLPTFRWWGLATTNYDRLIEDGYASATGPHQSIVPLIENGDRVDDFTRDPDNVILLKLHGCISRIANANCRLILTIDQYIDHRNGRSRLFEQLMDWGYEHALVFVGHSLQDSDIRQLIKDMSREGSFRSRFYCVVPDADDIERRALELQRITILQGTFEDFLRTLDQRIPLLSRALRLAAPISKLPIAERFRDKTIIPSSNLIHFLSTDAEYIKALTVTTSVAPADFYKGFNPGFSAIEQGLDLRRPLADEILTDIFLANESDHLPRPEVVLIKAHAGAGKTVLLRRLAWDATRDYDRICIYLKTGGIINTPALQELIDSCSDRVYLFVDDAADRVRELESLLTTIGVSGARLTILVAERINEWNVSCQSINHYVSEEFELRYLTSPEIVGLLDLLQKHNAEGVLRDLTQDEKKAVFEDKAGRQLLVALHEATFGLPFMEIIKNEFDNIWPLEAKQIYLTICVLNRLNVPVRAGVISRIHGVPFEEFKQRLFSPLEHIVQTQYDDAARDYNYRARHPHIAEMVFETILVRQSERFDAYLRALGALNIDYSTDRIAFRRMTRAKAVLDLFQDHAMGASIYKMATERAGDADGVLLQQMALYEMNRPSGELSKASELLLRAEELRPYDGNIKHSLAELQYRLAESSRTSLEKEKHLREAASRSREYNLKARGQAYGYVTLAKVGLARLEDSINHDDGAGIEQAIKDVEQALLDGFQRAPDNSYLRDAEARLAELMSDSDRAMAALQRGFDANPKASFIAIRLAQLFSAQQNAELAQSTLERALEVSSNDKRLHFAYARLLMDRQGRTDSILYHLQRSFIQGDDNFEAQLLYGRQLYLQGDLEKARSLFRQLKMAPVSTDVRFHLYYPLAEDFTGEVTRLESTYCFIIRDGVGDWVYGYRDNVGPVWSTLRVRARVRFRIGFSFAGACAFEVRAARPD